MIFVTAPLAAQDAPPPASPAKATVEMVAPADPVTKNPVTPPAEPMVVPPKAEAPATPPPTKTAPKKATDLLRPGQFIFEKHDSYEGALKIVAVLDIQRMYVYLDDQLIAFSTISAGKRGKETPIGYFNILQKNIDHKSNLYSNAPMPYMQRLTWDGIALHAGHIPGYAASHGCIRMPLTFAKSLYGITKMGQEVLVLKDLQSPRPVRPEPVVKPTVVTPPAAAPQTTTPQPVAPPVSMSTPTSTR